MLISFGCVMISKINPHKITVVSNGWDPKMHARRAFLVTTLAIYESNISEDVVFTWFCVLPGREFLARNRSNIVSVKIKTITIQADF